MLVVLALKEAIGGLVDEENEETKLRDVWGFGGFKGGRKDGFVEDELENEFEDHRPL